jgi:hypothetical protein
MGTRMAAPLSRPQPRELIDGQVSDNIALLVPRSQVSKPF